MDVFDVFIIGSGPGGIASALQAARLGLKVGIAEKETIGGTSVNMGADPSKCLLRNAEIAYFLRQSCNNFGISFDNLTFDYPAAIKRSRMVAKTLSDNALSQLSHNRIAIYQGAAYLTAPDQIRINYVNKKESLIQAKHVIIATGVSPMQVPEMHNDGMKVITFREAILQESLPSSVLIIGGGALGVEFASIFNGYGTEVTIVEAMSHLVPYEDEDISKALTTDFINRGIRVMTNSKVNKIDLMPDSVHVSIGTPSGTTILEVLQVLESYSFKHNSSNMGLEKIGVNIGQNGLVITDTSLSTNIPGIWAVGDVNGKLMLAASAREMGISVARRIGKEHEIPLDFISMPKVTYCHPQIASFGLTEKQALQQGYNISVSRQNFNNNGMALALGDCSGFVKIIINNKDKSILGSHLLGARVSELLPELIFASNHHHPITDISSSIHAHPSLGETISQTAENFEI